MKLIIDTDIGDDIDDAFALLLAMDMKVDLIGVTTVYKNTVQRAKMAKKILTLWGEGYENVPVYAGYNSTFNSCDLDFSDLCQYTEDLEKSEYAPTSKKPQDAIDFIIESCYKYGDELVVLGLGPFTNLAKVIEKDKEALPRVKNTLIMGGAYYKMYADWNIMCDVEGGAFLFENCPNLIALGADVTHKLNIEGKVLSEILKYNGDNKAKKYIIDLHKMWCVAHPERQTILHDPLLVHYFRDNSVVELESIPIKVITDGYAKGLTLNLSTYSKCDMNEKYSHFDFKRNTHKVGKTVNAQAVIERFKSMFI